VKPKLRNLVLGNPVGRAFAVVGDSWTQLILREAFFGVRRFSDWHENLKLPRTVLSNRLQHLVEAGLLALKPAPHGGARPEYRLTEMGLDLYGVSLMQGEWERRYAPSAVQHRYSISFYDQSNDAPIHPVLLSRRQGHLIDPRRVTYEVGPGLKAVEPPDWRRRRTANTVTDRPMIDRSVEIIGDYWSWSLISAALFHIRRYDEFIEATGMATNILADRLVRLVEAGIFRREAYQDSPVRFEYRLTTMGLDLYPVALAMHGWSEKWLCNFDDPPLKLLDRITGERITPVVCAKETGEPLHPSRVRWVMETPRPSAARARKR
jgi:DNA-binding HxlR family transcriptional regulator